MISKTYKGSELRAIVRCDGIEFEGHPNMIPLLLPPDWTGGYPLRKDFKGEGIKE